MNREDQIEGLHPTNVWITSNQELMLKRLIHVVKFIEMALLVLSFVLPILNWVITLAALTTETALDLYTAMHSDTVKELHQATLNVGADIPECLLLGAFLSFRALKFSKSQALSQSTQSSKRLCPIIGGSGLSSGVKKTPNI